MECENFSYKKKAEKREKLDYDEIVHCNRQSMELWNSIISGSRPALSKDDICKAIKDGIPKLDRGEIWMFLANQQELEATPVDENQFPQINTPYNVLLTNLTEHQHAIFIDLGRTFPNLSFYKGFGVGQLGLFNLLKAYSNLDVDLGKKTCP
jgi:TBC1 domain family member 4